MKNSTRRNIVYEEFHKSTKQQQKLINLDNFTYRLIFNVLGEYIPVSKYALDIGCGAGTISLYLASQGIDTLGFDISERAINEAKKSAKNLKLPNVEFKVINFPYAKPNGKFDLILCFEVLEHLKSDELALKKIYQLLNKSGIIIISVPSRNAPLHKIGYADDFDKRVGHLRRYTTRDLSTKIKKNNFEIVEIRETEGILRNFLFLNPIAGKLVRFMKSFIGDIFTRVDSLSLKLFGESQIIIVARKK